MLSRASTTRWSLKMHKINHQVPSESRSPLQNNPSSLYSSQGLPHEAPRALPELSTKTKPCSQSRGRQHLGQCRLRHAIWGAKKLKRRLSRTSQLSQLVARQNLTTFHTSGCTTTRITRTLWQRLRQKCRLKAARTTI